MDELKVLLATDHRRTLEFFFVHLQDVTEGDVDRQELLYNDSVLAHYAQISTCASGDVPAPAGGVTAAATACAGCRRAPLGAGPGTPSTSA